MTNEITVQNGAYSITIDISRLVEDMNSEQAEALVSSVLLRDYVFKEVINRLTDESQCWAGNDSDRAMEFLSKCKEFALSRKFNELRQLCDRLRDNLFDNRLYWKLYHCDAEMPNGERVGTWFWRWAEANGFKQSNYCDEDANAIADGFGKKVLAEIHTILNPPPVSEAA